MTHISFHEMDVWFENLSDLTSAKVSHSHVSVGEVGICGHHILSTAYERRNPVSHFTAFYLHIFEPFTAGLSEIFSNEANQELWLFSYDIAVNNTVEFQWIEH